MKMYCVVVAVILVIFIVTTAVSSSKLPCVHGVLEFDRCGCEEGYVGQRCHRKMHCSTFMRNLNRTCIACKKGWTGSYCDEIVCHSDFGTPTNDSLMCECVEPAIGTHCSELTTENVYLHYNKRMVEFWGPMGALALIPMIVCFFLCERSAEKRQDQRIKKHFLI